MNSWNIRCFMNFFDGLYASEKDTINGYFTFKAQPDG